MKQHYYFLFLFLTLINYSCSKNRGTGVSMTKEDEDNQLFISDIKPDSAIKGISSTYDVTNYDLDIKIHLESKSVEGQVMLKAKAIANVDSLTLVLIDPLIIDGIRLNKPNGEPLSYRKKGDLITVRFPQTISSKNEFLLFVSYHGKPGEASLKSKKPGILWLKDKSGKDWVTIKRCRAGLWWPSKSNWTDLPDSMTIKLTMPGSDLNLITNGKNTDTLFTKNQKTFIYKINHAISAAKVVFFAGNYVSVADTHTMVNGKTLPITYHLLSPKSDSAIIHFKRSKSYIGTMESIWGEYPWYLDGYKLIQAPSNNNQYRSAIAYVGNFTNNLFHVEDHEMLHCTAHEWWSTTTTPPGSFRDVWLIEALATYSEVLYFEKNHTRNITERLLAAYKRKIRNDEPLYGVSRSRGTKDVFYKGVWVLHSLRQEINNDSIFFKALKEFYLDHKTELVKSSQFKDKITAATGKDYDWFFRQYLFRKDIPVLEYSYDNNYLYYRWVHVHKNFNQSKVALINQFNRAVVGHIYPSPTVQALLLKDFTSIPYVTNEDRLFKTKKNAKLGRIYQQQTGTTGKLPESDID